MWFSEGGGWGLVGGFDGLGGLGGGGVGALAAKELAVPGSFWES